MPTALAFRNVTSGPAVDIALDDIGVTIEPGNDYSVYRIGVDTVARSWDNGDLFDNVQTSNNLVLVTSTGELSQAQTIAVLNKLFDGDITNAFREIDGDSGSIFTDDVDDILNIIGVGGISTIAAGDTITIDGSGVLSGAVSDFASVLVGRTTDLAIGLTWGNVTWQTTHLENNAAVIEHNNVNTERIDIKETGLYLIATSVSFDADAGEETIETRVVIDDTTVVPGSIRAASEDDEINDLSNVFTAELTAGTYITLQSQASGLGNFTEASSNMSVTKASSVKGDTGATGATGSGSNINVEDGGVIVAGGPFDTLNFAGTNIDVTDAGGGAADVEVVYGSEFQFVDDATVSTTTSTTFQNKLTLNTTTLPAGTYRVDFAYSWNHDATDSDFEAEFVEDASQIGEIHKQEPQDSAGTFSTTASSQRMLAFKRFYRVLTAGSYTYELNYRTDAGGAESSIWDASIELVRVQ